MGFEVKITTIRALSELFCPHYCLMCGKLGEILCAECKNYNIHDHVNHCLKCGVVVRDRCSTCSLPYNHAWMVGYKSERLGEMIDKFKYQSVRALVWPLAEMLAAVLPCLPEDTIVVPLPTIRRHVRERGLDHAWLLGKRLAMLKGWRCDRLVARMRDSVQVGASAEVRRAQAKVAYGLRGDVRSLAHYLVLDDVYTTGASVEAVCGLLRDAGAQNVMVAVLARAD